jgi:HEAT repeat protein
MNASNLFALVHELLARDDDESWHTLREIGQAAAPAITLQLAASTSPAIRKRAVEVLSQLRRPSDVQVFAAALADSAEPVWQAALDALLSQPTSETVEILRASLAGAAPNGDARKAGFLREALQLLAREDGVRNGTGGHA